ELLNAAKERYGSETPRIAFTMVLMRSNIEELPLLVELAARHRVAAVGAVHMVPLHEHLETETLNAFPEITNVALTRARELGRELGVHTNLPPLFDIVGESAVKEPQGPVEGAFPRPAEASAVREAPALAPPRSVHPELARVNRVVPVLEEVSCHFPWRFITINTEGDVSPCGWWYHQPTMGNLFRESFVEILRGDDYAALRSEHRCGTLREVCRACPAVGMGSVDSDAAFEGIS
ncbi:MAG: SPASM domain-containing protein, partial [Planctomycetota bacterium]